MSKTASIVALPMTSMRSSIAVCAFSIRSTIGGRNRPSLARTSASFFGVERRRTVGAIDDLVTFGPRRRLLVQGTEDNPMIRHHRAPKSPPIFFNLPLRPGHQHFGRTGGIIGSATRDARSAGERARSRPRRRSRSKPRNDHARAIAARGSDQTRRRCSECKLKGGFITYGRLI